MAAGAVCTLAMAPAWAASGRLRARMEQVERRHGGRLGVAVLDAETGRLVGHRLGERFLMCSTAKLMIAAAVLARCDRGVEHLDRRVAIHDADLLGYAPVTRHHVGAHGLSVGGLCEAALTVSDNTAANLLLASIGGPAAMTRFVRSLGDPVTRFDRTEPDLNVAAPGDVRDTTTPAAMAGSMRHVLLGSLLSEPSRRRLIGWMRASRTGGHLLRAGLPAAWTVGDKSGRGSRGETNDVALIERAGTGALIVAAYYVPPRPDDALGPPVLAAVGHLLRDDA